MKRFIKNVLNEFLWRTTSARVTQAEKARISKLRKEISSLPPLSTSAKNSDAENKWIANRQELREDIMNRDIRNFLRWNVIQMTMFHRAKEVELEYIKLSSLWPRYQKAFVDNAVGNPHPYPSMLESSGNLIHCGYHIARFLEHVEYSFEQTKGMIFEFGGGYGSMTRFIKKIGFKGVYVVFDLPEFIFLQEYYLRSLGYDIETKPSNRPGVIVLLSNLNDLKKQIGDTVPDLFIATWSLSESPFTLRQEILTIIPDSRYWIIAYQKIFEDVNNEAHFEEFMLERPQTLWYNEPINHLKNSSYVFGRRK